MRRSLLVACTLWLGTSLAAADPLIEVGTHELLPNTPSQTVRLFVSGGDAVQGLNFNLQVADGGPEVPGGSIDGPAITDVDILTATIFDGNNTGAQDVLQDLGLDYPQAAVYTTTTLSGTVAADGLLATVTIDTTGFYYGTWDLRMEDTFNGPTDFAGIGATVLDGSITIQGGVGVPEPASVALLLLGGALLAVWRWRASRFHAVT